MKHEPYTAIIPNLPSDLYYETVRNHRSVKSSDRKYDVKVLRQTDSFEYACYLVQNPNCGLFSDDTENDVCIETTPKPFA